MDEPSGPKLSESGQRSMFRRCWRSGDACPRHGAALGVLAVSLLALTMTLNLPPASQPGNSKIATASSVYGPPLPFAAAVDAYVQNVYTEMAARANAPESNWLAASTVEAR